jgi:hypothetical protein
MQTPGQGVSTDDYWDIYAPTASLAPDTPSKEKEHRTFMARYNPAENNGRGALEVMFRGNSRRNQVWIPYRYNNVPPDIWDGFKGATSPGMFINANSQYFSNYQANTGFGKISQPSQ